MKIVFLASYPQSLINFRLSLMKEFIKKGHEVVAIAPHEPAVANELLNHKIKYIPLHLERNGINPLADIKLIFSLWKILKKERPHSIFSYTIKPVIYGSISAKLARVPSIYSMITGTGYVFLDNNFKSRIVGLIARNLFRFALYFNHLIFFQNQDNLEFFRHKKIISYKKPVVIVNGSGVDCNQFTPSDYPAEISFLMIARFLHDKGIREYYEAAKIIKKRYPYVNFKLVGWIDTNPNSITQNELNNWINDNTINYLGKLSDVRDAIAASSVYVLPSYHEGTPRTVLEAMAMARPIITTNAPGCKETVIDANNGFLVPVKNIEKLSEKIEYFILHPEKIPIMGTVSRQLALDKYDVNKVNKKILTNMGID